MSDNKSQAARKKNDLTGQRFVHLVAVEPTDMKKNGYIIWKCKCDCGGEIMALSRYLKLGWTTNCGCIGRKKRYKNLAGQRFGRLVVREVATQIMPDGETRECRTENGRILWKCVCDCGKAVNVPGSQLLAGYRKSCNCLSKPPRKDWVGKKFGKLTVLEYAGKRNGAHRWKCRCDCGTITTVCQSNLQNGHTASCGCMVRPFASRNFVDGTCVEIIRSKTIFKSNTSGVRGVYPIKKSGRWAAQIQFKGEKKYLGSYDTIEEAARARQEAEIVFEQFLEQFDAGAFDDRIRTEKMTLLSTIAPQYTKISV